MTSQLSQAAHMVDASGISRKGIKHLPVFPTHFSFLQIEDHTILVINSPHTVENLPTLTMDKISGKLNKPTDPGKEDYADKGKLSFVPIAFGLSVPSVAHAVCQVSILSRRRLVVVRSTPPRLDLYAALQHRLLDGSDIRRSTKRLQTRHVT